MIGVLDRKAGEIEKEVEEVNILSPEAVFECPDSIVHILCCLNPFHEYIRRSNEVVDFFSSIAETDKTIYIYFLDGKGIKESGVISWNGRELIVDNLIYLVNIG